MLSALRALLGSGCKINTIEIVGYASPEYEEEYNLALSRGRAQAVAGLLVGEGLPAGEAPRLFIC